MTPNVETRPPVAIDAEAWRTLRDLLMRHLPGVRVVAYGSRVKGNPRSGSDLDLVAYCGAAHREAVAALAEALEDSTLPFAVDLHGWDELPLAFRGVIEADGVEVQAGAG